MKLQNKVALVTGSSQGIGLGVAQAEMLDQYLQEKGCRLTAVLEFTAPISELIQRFSGRRVCPVETTRPKARNDSTRKERKGAARRCCALLGDGAE